MRHKKSLLLFLTTILLVFNAAWSVSTYIRLQRASNQYKTDRVFESACQISKTVTKTGLFSSIIVLLLGLFLLFLSSKNLYIRNKI